MTETLSVTIVGPGSFGTALARALHAAGVRISEIVYRDAKSARRAKVLATSVAADTAAFGDAQFVGDVVWLCVGDSAIRDTAAAMADRGSWKRRKVFHSSGALSSDELAPLRRAGAALASVHPMMTFVRSSAPSMEGVTFALEGDAAALRVARKLVKAVGGDSLAIRKQDKALYHALGAFVSPLIIAQMAAVERIGRELRIKPQQVRRTIAPILLQTVRNYLAHGPAAAFSGPIVRGDVETVKRNLAALRRVRGAAEIYRALAKVAIEELPSKDAKGIKKTIRRNLNI